MGSVEEIFYLGYARYIEQKISAQNWLCSTLHE